MNLTAIRERIAVDMVRLAPKGLFSAAVGWGARSVLPRPVRPFVYRAFARRVGASLEEVELPLKDYPSLGHFFARRLRPGSRSISLDPRAVISPCDGTVAAAGVATNGHLIQAKGMGYSLRQLVRDESLAATLEGGTYLTIYLSPADYHRVHIPIPARLLGHTYIPGTMFPVNPLFSRSVDGLMAKNERVIFHLDADSGEAALVMVAAVGVANIEIAHDSSETRHLRANRAEHRNRLDESVQLHRGDELGAFHLGSTTIMIFEPGSVDLDPVRVGDKIRFGQRIGQVRLPDHSEQDG